ncbi:MAG: 30S ribosomal protein S17 [Proteobacteria bacterium]|nr:30S ribosomal protein S17 [Pseudomonadota bacterium]
MKERGIRKKLTGVVIANKMEKTAVVLVSRLKRHGTYKKYITKYAKYIAHDPQDSCQIGDRVRIIESKPISKTKRWQVMEILERSIGEASEQ